MGVKTRRPALAGYAAGNYGADLDGIVSVIMIEKRVALDDIEAILERASELGVDMTQWGPSDYGFSFDERPSPDEIRAAEEKTMPGRLEYGSAPHRDGAVEQAQRYLARRQALLACLGNRFLSTRAHRDRPLACANSW